MPGKNQEKRNWEKIEMVSFLVRLNRAADSEFADAGLKSSALHAEEDGGALGAGDTPLGMLQGPEDVLALGVFESGDGRG
jgi:hypothetical protein